MLFLSSVLSAHGKWVQWAVVGEEVLGYERGKVHVSSLPCRAAII